MISEIGIAIVCRYCGACVRGPAVGPSNPKPPAQEDLGSAFFAGMKSGTAVGCPLCGKTVRVGDRKCARCGVAFTGDATSLPVTPVAAAGGKSLGKLFLYGLGALILLGFIGSQLPAGQVSPRKGIAGRSPATPSSMAKPKEVPRAIPPVPAEKWGYRVTDDPMTSRKNRVAAISSENTVNFRFPRGRTPRTLIVRQHPQRAWCSSLNR